MSDFIPVFEAPPPKPSALEERARAIAARAQNHLHAASPRFPSWDDLGDHAQASLMMTALSVIVVVEAMNDPSIGAH